MKEIDQNTIEEIKNLVYSFFSEECDIPAHDISDTTKVIDDLEGDSLMLLSLLESVRKKYSLSIELKTLGKHLMKKPADTVGEVITLTLAVVKYGNDIVNVDM